MSKAGRPKTDNPKGTQLQIRMDAGNWEELDFLVAHYGFDKSKLIRILIHSEFKEIISKYNLRNSRAL